jgi:hypothetical protein
MPRVRRLLMPPDQRHVPKRDTSRTLESLDNGGRRAGRKEARELSMRLVASAIRVRTTCVPVGAVVGRSQRRL